MPWYLFLALKQLFPTRRRFPFFTAISVLSVALGVALLILVLGVMGGFGAEIRRMIVDTQGEVQVRADSGFVSNPELALGEIEAVQGVVAAMPYAEGVVMIEHAMRPAFPTIHGIDLDRVDRVVPLRKYVRVGSLDDLDDDSVIISAQLARSIGARMGSRIQVSSLLMLERLKRDEIILPRELTVVGIMEVGHQQLDSSMLLSTLRTMQELYGMGRMVHGFNVRIAPGLDPDRQAALINSSLPQHSGMTAKSWMDLFQEFLWVLQLEKNMMLFILLFVVLVAAFLTMSLLLVLVFKKTREIGLLRALGAGRGGIALCFSLQGVLIGVAGTGLGLILGFTALHFRNDAVWLLTRFTGSQEIMARFYQFSQLPAHSETLDVVVIVLSAIALSTLAGLVPALLAARMKPVEALRSE